jgi:DNA modification methylase
VEPGTLYCDDNLARLQTFPDESADLIYLDPPFFSNRFYEVIWGDEAEVRSFEDRWEGGIEHYTSWMRDRVLELHRVLKPTGSLYLHCDPHASHYLKRMLDGIFGEGNFRSEIIWKRTSAHNSAKRWGPIHDTLFFYSKTGKYTWNPVFLPLPEETAEGWYNNIEEDSGRRYNRADLTAPGRRKGSSGETWRDIDVTAKGRHWAIPRTAAPIVGELDTLEALDALDAAGLIHWPKKRGGAPMLKRFLDESKGIPPQDVITDIYVNNIDIQRLGYPTQKPEALLERIVAVSSNPGDLVLDPFCGCGTTIAVSENLKREWVGIDISLTAMEIMRRRLLKQTVGQCSPRIENLPTKIEDLKALKPFEFQNWVINAVHGTHSPRKTHDMGIDGYWFLTRDPVQVKQSEKVGRVEIDKFETAIRRAGHDSGYIVAFSFGSGAKEEVARAKWEDKVDIRLIPASALLETAKARPIDYGPQPGSVEELFLPAKRKASDLPSAEELIESDTAAG